MDNILTGKVQIFTSAPRVVQYHPDGFPDVIADADVIALDGETLTILRFWWAETIHISQVVSGLTPWQHEVVELHDVERLEFDQLNERA